MDGSSNGKKRLKVRLNRDLPHVASIEGKLLNNIPKEFKSNAQIASDLITRKPATYKECNGLLICLTL